MVGYPMMCYCGMVLVSRRAREVRDKYIHTTDIQTYIFNDHIVGKCLFIRKVHAWFSTRFVWIYFLFVLGVLPELLHQYFQIIREVQCSAVHFWVLVYCQWR